MEAPRTKHSPRVRTPGTTLGALLVPLVLFALLAGCAHVIEPGIPFQPGKGRYDFSRPLLCKNARAVVETTRDDQVVVRYLGAGGLYVGWRGKAVLLGPFFSNPSELRVIAGHVRPKEGMICDALKGLPVERVGAILAGHSHYDHIGDLPVIARKHTTGASLVLNRSGVAALNAYPDLLERTRDLESIEGRWTALEDAGGSALPFRLLALPSDHAPHAAGLLVMDGETRPLPKEFPETRYWKLKTGRTYAFVLDLLGEEDEGGEENEEGVPHVAFRILYQDAASTGLAAALPAALADGVPVDLAVLCMPSAHLVPPYPARVLAASSPAHALIIHYESFFRSWGRSAPFVPFLTRKRAEGFLRTVNGGLGSPAAPQPMPLAPKRGEEALCGPSGEGWTMPLVGQALVFQAR